MSGSLNGFPHELSSESTVHVGHLWDEIFTFSSMGRKVLLHEPNGFTNSGQKVCH